jgi:hypothetical protein
MEWVAAPKFPHNRVFHVIKRRYQEAGGMSGNGGGPGEVHLKLATPPRPRVTN